MVRKILTSVLNAEVRGLHQAAYLLAFFTFGSQVLALVRDRLLASTFGASETLDLYYAAFKIPDILYVLIASLVSVYILVPFLNEAQVKGKQAVQTLLSELVTFFTGLMGLVAILGVLFAPAVCGFLFPSIMEDQGDSLVLLVRILLLQPILLGLSNLLASYVQVRGRFVVYALAPLLYNMGIIVGIVWLYPLYGIEGLAYGVLLGSMFHLFVQMQFLLSEQMLFRVKIPSIHLVKRVIRVSVPRTLALTSQQLVLLLLLSLASWYATGSIASFSLASNLQAVPLAIIGVSYSVAAFPKLARFFVNDDKAAFFALVVSATRQIVFWSLPAMVLLVVLRAQIVRVVFGAGAFDWSDTIVTAAVLAVFACSLLAQAMTILLARVFYAMNRTWTPVVASVSGGVVTVLSAGVCVSLVGAQSIWLDRVAELFRLRSIDGVPIVLFALSFSLGAYVTAFLLTYCYRKQHSEYIKALMLPFAQSLGASLLAGVGAFLALRVLDDIVTLTTVAGVFSQGFAAGVTGLVIWVLVLTGFGNSEIATVWGTLLSRIRLTKASRLRGIIEP